MISLIPTVEFCSGDITTVGPNNTLGALCPFDPDTKKRMERCLNWRRTDPVGYACFSVMNIEDKEKSMDVFCGKDYYLADCKCINRRYYKEYQEQRPHMTILDYCWYFSCAGGAFLTKRKGKKVLCINERCEPVYFLGIQYKLKCIRTETGYPDGLSEPMSNPDY